MASAAGTGDESQPAVGRATIDEGQSAIGRATVDESQPAIGRATIPAPKALIPASRPPSDDAPPERPVPEVEPDTVEPDAVEPDTHNAEQGPGEPPPALESPAATSAPGRTRRRGLVGAAVVLLLLGFVAAGVTVQLRRVLPGARLSVTVPPALRIPGPALALPWPALGSAELMVEGLGRVGGSHADTPASIGSVAKVMTAYLVLKHHPLAGAEPGPRITVTVADVADYKVRRAGGQSLVAVVPGEVLTERQALEALLLPSANNIAHLLGVWDAGTADAFVTSMNDAAAKLGMTRTRYTDPSGFLATTTSTPADQVTLARAALADPVFAALVAEPSAVIPVAGRVRNYNDLLGRDGVFGVKTGSTSQAGGNLVFASRLVLDGTPLTVVGAVFHQPGAGTPAQLARTDTVVRQLLTSIRSALRTYQILPLQPVGRITTAWGARVAVRPAAALKVIGWPGMSVPVRLSTTTLGGTVRPGAVVGQVEARPGGTPVRVDLRTDAATGEPSLWWRLTRRR